MNEVDTEFFALVSADDLLTREWYETMASLLEAYPKAKIASSNTFVVEEETVLTTDLIDVSNGTNAGVYDPREFAKAVFRIGKLPPSNTIMYRSDIIKDLALPVFSQLRLGPVVDVMLILEVAMRHPTAYSTKAMGVFFKSSGSYGSTTLDVHRQRHIVERIEEVIHLGKLVESDRFVLFVNRSVEYAWIRQAIMLSQAENRANRTGLGYLWEHIGRRREVHSLSIIIDERLLRCLST